MRDTSRKVYFARCIGPTGQPIGAYKIGCSYGHNDRLKSITATLPFTLELVGVTTGSMVMEAVCHLHLKPFRIAGEYFRECPDVDALVARVADTGEAFHYIRDSGYDGAAGAAFAPFMAYHGVTVADVAEFLHRPVAAIETLLASREGHRSRNIAAAVALIAAKRQQYVRWPDNLIHALNGGIYHSLHKSEAA